MKKTCARWEPTTQINDNTFWKCSACGAETMTPTCDSMTKYPTLEHCPACHAEMAKLMIPSAVATHDESDKRNHWTLVHTVTIGASVTRCDFECSACHDKISLLNSLWVTHEVIAPSVATQPRGDICPHCYAYMDGPAVIPASLNPLVTVPQRSYKFTFSATEIDTLLHALAVVTDVNGMRATNTDATALRERIRREIYMHDQSN